MELDIRTIIIIIGITHLIQLLVFIRQYRISGDMGGPGWWMLWSAAASLGVGLILLRSIPALLPFVIVVQNGVLLSGPIFIHIGLLRFFDRSIPWKRIVLGYGSFLALHLFFIFVKDDIVIRIAIVDASVAIMALVIAANALRDITGTTPPIVKFNAILFVIYGLIFSYRGLIPLFGLPPGPVDLFAPTPFNLLRFLGVFVLGLLWSFGLILMVHQRLRAGIGETKAHFEQIFNASPDAAVITRLDDGLYVDCNEGFSRQLGYAKEEAVGKSTAELSLWDNPENAAMLFDEVRSTGSCENHEATFRRKDGSLLTGLMTARTVILHETPHVITVTRDISERKKEEAERERLIAELQSALDQVKTLKGIVPICAGCKKIRDDTGLWEGVESFVSRHTEARFSHSICPDCIEKLYPEHLTGKKPTPRK